VSSVITAISLPIDWESFELPRTFSVSGVVVMSGPRGWSWSELAPDLDVSIAPGRHAAPIPGFQLDHIVLLVPDLDRAAAGMAARDFRPLKRVIVRDRSTAFFLAGTLLEVIEEPTVDRPSLWGLALQTAEPLGSLVERWRALGHDVSDPRPAYQQGSQIVTVRGAGAGLAVMSLRKG